ncbi:beta-ketoacyl-[acyl-carrier-protein] synthase III [Flavobacteriaceae bacterium UJ101]|nr:beta-ketoacyl-[acyl-carrier-protein] synthase III [Flavobacteriaceae bacterium UJ101]
MTKSIISGVGHYVPEKIVTNHDLSKLMDTSHEWIVERSGIEERRFAERGKDTTASLAYEASKKAIADAGLQPEDIDFIIFATLSPDYYFPGGGVQLQEMLGIGTIGALDVRNQCSGFIYSLSVADKFIQTNTYKNILVVGAEIHSYGLDLTTRGRTVSVLFGDGAGAVVVSGTQEEGRGILSTRMHSEGKNAEELALLAPGNKYKWANKVEDLAEIQDHHELWSPYMNGQHVFKNAVARFPETIMDVLQANNKTPQDLNLLVPHQANLRISQFVQKILGLGDDQVYNNIQKYGNTTAATIPIALSEAKAAGKIKKGDLVCMAAFGSGFTWGSVLMNW